MIRYATSGDVPGIAALAAARREQYARHQPLFWRPARDATDRHQGFLSTLIDDESWGCFVAPADDGVAGYLFATLQAPPPVYDPGGPSCAIDDFWVATRSLWPTTGAGLLDAATGWGRDRGASQLVVVSAARDQAQADLLARYGMTVASTWWTAPIPQ